MHRDPLGAAHARIAELEGTVRELKDKVNALEAAARGEPSPVLREIDVVTHLEGKVERLRGTMPSRVGPVLWATLSAMVLSVIAGWGTRALPYCLAAYATVIGILLIERRGARRLARRALRRAERRLAEARERATYEGPTRVRVDALEDEPDEEDVSQRDSVRARR